MNPGISQAQRLAAMTAAGAMHVSFTGENLQVSAVLDDIEAVDKLIKALQATKALLPEKAAKGDV